MTTRSSSPALLSFLVALLAGCADAPLAPGTGTPGGPGGPPAAVAAVVVAPAAVALEIGGTTTLVARPLDAGGTLVRQATVTWTSTDTAVATVSAGGLVRAHGAGAATIRASSGGKIGGVAVTVAAKPVAWIQITPSGGSLPQAVGTTRQLGVVAYAAGAIEIPGRVATWASSDTTVAAVSANGLLQARATGRATITAQVDGRRDSLIVTVPTLVARIETSAAALALGVGDGAVIVATAVDALGAPLPRPFAWTSSNTAVVRVDEGGRVLATGAGSAVVTVTSEGRSATVVVTVTGAQWRLADVAGAPLPAILYTTTTTVDGLARETRFQVSDGTLRLRDGRYELRLQGWLLVDGVPVQPATIGSDGVYVYDVFSGAPLFHEGDDWTSQEPRFRSRIRADGSVELLWNRQAGAPTVALGFAR